PSLQERGFKVWSAAESGLRYVLEDRGIETLDAHELRPRGPDLIVRQTAFSYSLGNELEPLLTEVARFDLQDSFPVRTSSFHDSHLAIVPFRFSRVLLDRVNLVQVSPFVKSLPQTVPADFSSVPVWSKSGVILKQVDAQMTFPMTIPRGAKPEYELEGEGSVSV